MAKAEWNPRFLLYCKEVGADQNTPLSNLDYHGWIEKKIREFFEVDPDAFYRGWYRNSLVKFDRFDKWLNETVKEPECTQ